MKRLIIISNRLPFVMQKGDDCVEFTPSAGGLVSSLKSYLEKMDTIERTIEPIWVGTSDIHYKEFKRYFVSEFCSYENYKIYPVFMTKELSDKHYNGFCNDSIWPLFHYFPSYAKFKDDFYKAYQVANKLYADKVISVYKPGDIIWIHDYHLMLLPALLRKRLPDAEIGFFLHIPFPSRELFRILPSQWRKDILHGLTGADLVGFHTNDYVKYFLSSVKQTLGYDSTWRGILTPEGSMTAEVFPISIDFNKFYSAIKSPDVFRERNEIKKSVQYRKIIISVDRLDYTKAIVNRLEGFELFLKNNPKYHGNVTYLLTVVPSRDTISRYRENKRLIDEQVSKINGKYGDIHWSPIIYQYRSLDFNELTGLYLAADVALVTPVRDGMNLVAKEFIATRADKKGVLVLSETAGAASELGEAIIINPTDRNEIAQAIITALNMPVQEQIARNEIMQNRLRNYDVIKWAEDFISALRASKERQEVFKVKEISPKTEATIIRKYNESERRLIFLDYDGTLTPLVRMPHSAVPDDDLINLLKKLTLNKKNMVIIISGRTKKNLQEWFGNIPVHLVAEHGAFVKNKSAGWQQIVSSKPDWKEAVLPIMQHYSERCAGASVEEKDFSMAWHYRNADADLAFVRSRELLNNLSGLSSHMDFQIIEGNKVVEARSRGIDKGIVAGRWLKDNSYDFVLAIGDDRTDEDLFKVIPDEGFTIRVGLVSSVAQYNVKNSNNVRSLLKSLI